MNLRARRTSFFFAALATLALAFVCVLPATHLHAQEEKAPAAEQKPAARAEPAQESAGKKEAAEEKEQTAEDEGKASGAVQGLAKITGMTVDHAYWFSVILNFVLVAFILVYFAVKKLPGTFRDRTTSIQKGMEEARKSSEAAQARLAEVEGRLSRLDTEIAKMRSEAEEMSRAEEKRLLSEGEAERRRIVSAAEQEIAAAAGGARRELKAYAAELAVDLATKKIRVEKSTDQALVSEFTAGMGKDGN
jgi:F-type H+-transporting ATPase subunit b